MDVAVVESYPPILFVLLQVIGRSPSCLLVISIMRMKLHFDNESFTGIHYSKNAIGD